MDADLSVFLLCIASIFFSQLLYQILFRFSGNLGVRNFKEQEIRWSTQIKPSLGGIVFFMNFLFAVMFWFFFHSHTYLSYRWQIAFFLGGASVAFLMGLADDAYNTNPTLKLLAQLLCGCSLVFSGLHFNFFPFPFLNYCVTVFFVVLIMNAMNLLDNMDGISGGMALVITLNLLIYQYVFNQPLNILGYVLMCNVCSLLVFLFYNIYPSKIYMGDSGSQFQGYVLSASTVILFSSLTSRLYLPGNIIQPFMILFIFLLPVTDVLTVFIQRLWRGQSPFIGGKDHTNHALYYFGLSENKIFLLYIFLQLISCTLSLLFIFFSDRYWLLILSLVYALIVLFALFRCSYLYSVKGKKHE